MKAQLHMGETIAILFVFFMILVFGLFFYVSIQRSSAAKTFEKQSDITSTEIVQRASTLPELQCSSGNDVEDNCIDIFKAAILKEKMKEGAFQQYYADLFGLSKLTLKLISPSSGFFPPPSSNNPFSDGFFDDGAEKTTFTIYANPSSKAEQEQFTQSRTNVPITLYNPLTSGVCGGLRGSCAFAMMEITVFQRR